MKAVCLPQPWAGLVLSGQIEHVNAKQATSHRGELLIYAKGRADYGTGHNYRHVRGLMDVTDTYLGFVDVQSSNDPYEVDAKAYLGYAWFWHVQTADMLITPVEDSRRRPWGEVFMVPDAHRDAINASRIGWSAWWDRVLDAEKKLREESTHNAQKSYFKARRSTAGE